MSRLEHGEIVRNCSSLAAEESFTVRNLEALKSKQFGDNLDLFPISVALALVHTN